MNLSRLRQLKPQQLTKNLGKNKRRRRQAFFNYLFLTISTHSIVSRKLEKILLIPLTLTNWQRGFLPENVFDPFQLIKNEIKMQNSDKFK